MSLHIITWSWGSKYGFDYLRKLARGVRKYHRGDYRFLVANPESQDEYLTEIPGCLVRLRTFDPAWQADNGIAEGDRIACLDQDLIITGELDPLFDRREPFVILQGANSQNPCPYNGSMWMLRAGYRPDVWTGFSVAAAARIPWYAFPDDQSWFAHKMPGAAGWKAGRDGVYAFQKPGWPKGEALPADARLVAFPGHRDPGQFTHLDWVRRHWVC